MLSIARTFVGLVTTCALVASANVSQASDRQQRSRSSGTLYAAANPNRPMAARPRTRLFVTTRSWLDAGPEVQPGDRKFSDYALPIGSAFSAGNGNRALYREPMVPSSDIGGLSGRLSF
jgi:hypothetical protein